LSKVAYDKYYAGAATAYGIQIQQGVELRLPICLATIRNDSPNFRPPQSYAYLRPGDPTLEPLAKQLAHLQKRSA